MTGNRHEGIRAFLSVLLAFVIMCSGIPSEALSVVAEAGGAEPVPTQVDPVVEETLPVDAAPLPQPTPSQPEEVSEPVVNDDKVVVNEEKDESKVVHVRLEPNCEGVNRVEDVDVMLDGSLWSLPKGIYAREGHEFVGWSTTVDGRDVADDPGTADVDESRAAIGVAEGQELADLRFVSVETDADGVSHEVERDLSGYVTGDVLTLWAQWKPVEAPAAETEDAPVEEAMTGAEKGDEAIKGDASKSDAKADDIECPEAPKVSEDDVHEGVESKGESKESQAVKDVDANGAGAVKDEAGKIGDSGRLYEHRLIVGMGPTTMITAGVVLGRLDDAVLLGFEDEASLASAEALYKLTAEYVARDMALGVSDGEDVADVAMSAKDNPFAEASEANGLAGIPVTPQGVVIGLLDTGAPEDKHVVESMSVMGDNVKDVNGHATRMLDAMVDENSDVRVMSVKVLGDAGHGTASSVYAGVMHAVDNGAKVINMSFAGPDNEGNAAIREAVEYALEQDVVVIAAAGNGGYDAGLVTPANVDGVFTVGAAEGGKVRDDSNRGSCVDVYVEATSTSVAAAKASGQVSLGLDGWRERVSERLGVDVGTPVVGSGVVSGGDGVDAAADTTVWWGVSGNTLYLSASSGTNHTNSKALSEITSYSSVPWYSQRANVTTVVIDGTFTPICTSFWFYNCTQLTTFINWSNLKITAACTDTRSMFCNCSAMSAFPDMSDWDTKNVTDMSRMFYGCSTIVAPPTVRNWNVSNVMSLSTMFYRCSSLVTPPDVSGWNTSSVLNMSCMFQYCSSLTVPPDVSRWNTTNVTNMYYMFSGCSSLTTPPNVSGWMMNNVQDISCMFANCSALATPPDMSGWNTGNVMDMAEMFDNCSSLAFLDISSLDFSQLPSSSRYIGLKNCTSLKSLIVSADTRIATDFSEHSAQGCYKATWKNDSQSIVGSTAANMVTTINAGNGAGAWEWELNVDNYALLDANGTLTFLKAEKGLTPGTGRTVTDIDGTTRTGQLYVVDLDAVYNGSSVLRAPWYDQRSSIKAVRFAQVVKPTSMTYWFSDCLNLVDFDSTNLDVSNVTNMSHTFSGCSGASFNPDVSSWDTSNVTDMRYMFYGCRGAVFNPDVSSWDTSSVTNMNQMFYNCYGAVFNPDVSSWNMSSVTNMGSMFYGCRGAVFNPDVSSWNTSNVTNMREMFYNCYGAAFMSLDVSAWDFTKVTSTSNYLGLQYCNNLKELKVSATSKVTGVPEHSAQGDYAATWGNADRDITRSTAANMVTTINAGNGAGTWEWELAGYTVKLRAPVGLGVNDVIETVTATEDWFVPASPFTYAHHDFVEWSGSDGETYAPGDVIEANMFSSGDMLILTAVYEPHEYDGSDASANFVVTVPFSINYVLKADGTLVGPSNVRIENRNPFAVRVSSLDADALSPFDIVNEIGTSGTNVASVRMGPVGSQLNIADYLTKSDLPSGSAWEIAQMAGDVPGTLALATDGEARVVTDVTSLTGFASLNWYFKVAG